MASRCSGVKYLPPQSSRRCISITVTASELLPPDHRLTIEIAKFNAPWPEAQYSEISVVDGTVIRFWVKPERWRRDPIELPDAPFFLDVVDPFRIRFYIDRSLCVR